MKHFYWHPESEALWATNEPEVHQDGLVMELDEENARLLARELNIEIKNYTNNTMERSNFIEAQKKIANRIVSLEKKGKSMGEVHQTVLMGKELGELNEAILKFFYLRSDNKKAPVYLEGSKTKALQVAARAIMLYNYLETKFDEQGNLKK